LSCRKEAIDVPVRHGIYEDVLCAGTPEVYTFIEALVRQVCRLFPSDYLHFGGDECPTARWEECTACGAVMQQHGLDKPQALQGLLMNHAVQIAEEYDKKIVAWDEVLSVKPDFRPVTAVWRDVKYIKDAVAQNLQVVVSPCQKGTYLDHKHLDNPNEPGRLGVSTVKDVYTLDIFENLSTTERAFILGGQGNLWTEEVKYGRQVEYMAFPRLSALAENLWLPAANKDWTRFTRALGAHLLRLERLGAQPYRGALE
ncbi:MAG: family 20 glycosylhydrolase, partial [Spirochaetia bacterium]